jgi:hypothetical protein
LVRSDAVVGTEMQEIGLAGSARRQRSLRNRPARGDHHRKTIHQT